MKLLKKLLKAQDTREKTRIWQNADLGKEQQEQLVRDMILSLPVGHYRLHNREYGTNLVDKIYDMYGWMPSMLVSESTMLGLQVLYPQKVYATFTLGLDAIEIKKSSSVLKRKTKSIKHNKKRQSENYSIKGIN